MPTKYIVLVAAVTALVTTLAMLPLLVKAKKVPDPEIQVVVVEVPQPKLSPAQIIWFARLMNCESGIKATAVNPNDLDNTPSYGLLQFKPGTFNAAMRDLKLGTSTDYMDPELQVAIVEQWILRGGVNWRVQFPACVNKLGLPPTE